jgi:GNAT superfamily N-acetyltransferase
MKATLESSPRDALDMGGNVSAEAYAAGFRAQATLRDRTPVRVRAIRPDDKERLRIAFERLSPRSVYHRFFNPITELTDDALRHLTELDFRDHVGLGLTIGESSGERLIAVGRFVRVAPGADRAELAVTVADEYQHRGAATLLLRHLVGVARDGGVRELVADVLDDNQEMLEIIQNSKLPLQGTVAYGVHRTVLRLDAET